MTAIIDPGQLAAEAIDHLLGVLRHLSPADLGRPSACADWQVLDLLRHLTATADALTAHVRTGTRGASAAGPVTDPIGSTRAAVVDLRDALTAPPVDPAWTTRVAGDTAIEFTVHAWDLDPSLPLPDDLAAEVLAFASPLVDDAVRAQFFGPAIGVRADAPAGERLVAFLGRSPR